MCDFTNPLFVTKLDPWFWAQLVRCTWYQWHNCSWSWHTTEALIQFEHSGVWKRWFQDLPGWYSGRLSKLHSTSADEFKQQSPLIAPQTATCWDLQSLLCCISKHLAHVLIQGVLPDKYLILIKKMNKPDLQLYKSTPPATAVQSVYSSWVSIPHYGQFESQTDLLPGSTKPSACCTS